MKSADHTWQRVDRFRIERMLDRGDALGLERFDRLGDLVTEFDAADTLISPLNAGRLALDLDLKPDATDASRLDCQAAGLSGNSSVGLVAADDRVERAVPADFFVDYDINEHVALELDAGRFEKLDRKDVAGDTALHVA